MSSAFKCVLMNNGSRKTIIVRYSKNELNRVCNDPIINTLNILGLEKVPFRELVPSYKKIKSNDCVIGCECPICHETYLRGKYKRKLTCEHIFHKKCIDKWLKNNMTCPMCRKEIDVVLRSDKKVKIKK